MAPASPGFRLTEALRVWANVITYGGDLDKLPRCLGRLRDAGIQAMVVNNEADPEASDRIDQVCQEHGALSVKHAWDDDFAASRNEGLLALRQHVGEDKAWVVSIDTDEELLVDEEIFVATVQKLFADGADGARVGMRNVTEEGTTVFSVLRFLSLHHPGSLYQFCYHECPGMGRDQPGVVLLSPLPGLVIEHDGFTVANTIEKGKGSRNARFGAKLADQLEQVEKGKQVDPYAVGAAAVGLCEADWPRSRRLFESLLGWAEGLHGRERLDIPSWAGYWLIQFAKVCHVHVEDADGHTYAFGILRRLRNLYPGDPDLRHVEAELASLGQNHALAADLARLNLAHEDGRGAPTIGGVGGWQSLLQAGRSYSRMGVTDEALIYLNEAFLVAPSDHARDTILELAGATVLDMGMVLTLQDSPGPAEGAQEGEEGPEAAHGHLVIVPYAEGQPWPSGAIVPRHVLEPDFKMPPPSRKDAAARIRAKADPATGRIVLGGRSPLTPREKAVMAKMKALERKQEMANARSAEDATQALAAFEALEAKAAPPPVADPSPALGDAISNAINALSLQRQKEQSP